ncbi:MAG: putative manganese transporter, partial [Bacteroidetes bacterium]|nr:putative manganese transporter [Bacteroidota bacterium]
MEYWNLNQLTSEYTLTLLFLSALIGIIPDSGPHLIFVTMYAHGLIPFSVLFTSSVVQDGHGMLPMLAYSVKDSLLIKGFNIAIGLTIGLSLFLLGW